jgi:hypothetical protein
MNLKSIDWRAKVRPLYRFATKLPPVVRSLAGLGLIAAGFVGIVMPILGFWMAPLGLLFIAADIPPLRRRVERWIGHDDEHHGAEQPSSASAASVEARRAAKREPRRAAP